MQLSSPDKVPASGFQLLYWVIGMVGLWGWGVGCFSAPPSQRCHRSDPAFDVAACECASGGDCPDGLACVVGRCQRDTAGSDASKDDAMEPPEQGQDEPALDTLVGEQAGHQESPDSSALADEPGVGDAHLTEKTSDVAGMETRPEASRDAVACIEGAERSCYTGESGTRGVGRCRAGVQFCERGQWSEDCKGQRLPAAELCNGIDDDCDGKIDNDVAAKTCYEGSPPKSFGIGLCKSGISRCDNGQWSPCMGQVLPAAEICDGLDNDCDGYVDENCQCKAGDSQICGSSVGACEPGKQVCDTTGKWGACTGDIGPKAEICDGKDNDCDGQIDESDPDLGQACVVTGGKGECAAGKRICSAGKLTCQAGSTPRAEICDGKDNDCDGAVDEGISQPDCIVPGQVGVCSKGRLLCRQGAPVCVPQNANQTEVCDGVDNNCNGQIDEGFHCAKGERRCSSTGIVLVCSTTCGGYLLFDPCDNSDQICHQGVCLQCSCKPGSDFCDKHTPNTIFSCGISTNGRCEPIVKTVCPAGMSCSVTTTSTGPACK